MNRASDTGSTAARTTPPPAHREEVAPAIDLDRLVWDPEYRAAMRPWLNRAG